MKRKFKWDREESKRRGYLDRASFCTTTGKEFLGPKDWETLRIDVFVRDNHRCVKCGRVVPMLGDLGVRGECDHIIKRSQGGDDSLTNLQLLCPTCHRGPKGKHG